MKTVDRATVVALALLFASIWVVLAAGMIAVWLTEEVRVFGLVILPTGVVAGLLVVYFAWRDKLRRRALAERGGHQTAARTLDQEILLAPAEPGQFAGFNKRP